MEYYGRERRRGTVLMRPFSKFLKHIKTQLAMVLLIVPKLPDFYLTAQSTKSYPKKIAQTE